MGDSKVQRDAPGVSPSRSISADEAVEPGSDVGADLAASARRVQRKAEVEERQVAETQTAAALPVARMALTLAGEDGGAQASERARAARAAQGAVGNTRVGGLGERSAVQRVPLQSAAAPAFVTPKVGKRYVHPPGVKSAYKRISGEFDGREFVLTGDGVVLARVGAVSGRPVSVRVDDARKCGGTSADSYLNNPRYVGIAEFGPIPEGEFTFNADQLAMFSLSEQARFTLGGHFTDPFGRPMHGGDWGAGRAPLRPNRVEPALPGCGNTARRSGFYIHGGHLSGSSGCIDIGNAGIEALVAHIGGYRKPVVVKVRYRFVAPGVDRLERAAGGFTYPGPKDPGLVDRIKGALRELRGGDAAGGESE